MRLNVRRSATGFIALTALTLLPLACGPKDKTDSATTSAPVQQHALVRFVNATAYKEPVDVYLDEAKVLPGVPRGKATDYSEWAANRREIGVRVVNNPTLAGTNSESLSAGEHYTVVGYSKMDGTPAVVVFHDTASEPDAGKARIRLIHVADGAAELGVYPAGANDSIVDGVNYSDESSADVDPGVRALEIRKQGEKVVALKIPELSLEAGKNYTIVVAVDQDRKLRAIQLDSAGLLRQGLNR
jgi:uncharacterized protein DUF4397